MVFIGCRDRIATPLYAFCVTATLSYPSDLKASNGNSVPFNSCSNNTFGSRAFSHAVTCVSRERTEFKFQLATLNINPHSSVGVEGRSSAGKFCSLSGHKPGDFRLVTASV